MERFHAFGVRTGVKILEALSREQAGPRRGARSWRVIAAVVVATWALVGRGSDVHSQSPVTIEIRDSKYLPPDITVPVGTTVRWTNRDEEIHTVTSSGGLFGSAGLDLGEDYGHTFTKAGVYPYTCELHPFMHGTVTVN